MKDARIQRKKSEPSLDDVARKAGVSAASVSRVLNNVPPISEKLRAAVESAAAELGYVPRNPKAAHNSSMIAVFCTDLSNPVFTEIIGGIEDRASSHSLGSILIDLRGGRAPWDQVRNFFSNYKPLGHIVLGPVLSDQTLLELAGHGRIPLVVVNHILRHSAIRSVNIDHAKATYNATTHLLNLRHRRIAFLGSNSTSPVTEEKVKGVRDAFADFGLELRDQDVLPGHATIEWGFHATKTVIARSVTERPTAIVCSCDLIALGVLHAVRSLGLSVPKDVSVVGFDDIPMACHSNPALTTVSPPKYEMGALAVDLLLSSETGSTSINDYVMLESPLVVRESTAECSQK
ncbi:MAG: LacI family DNA-binding transcriptional regulator [Treponemataceae bacterium]